MATDSWGLVESVTGIGIATYSISRIWLSAVQREVADPYLDEVFHVRQAQLYCSGDFKSWDPKITTPPGLYLLSYIYFKVTGGCGIEDLRQLNQALVPVIAVICFIICGFLSRTGHRDSSRLSRKDLWRRAHTAINISLFPPLFFFSALYYTDIASTLFVLITFATCQLSLEEGLGFTTTLPLLIFGLASLLFRQTNIFWVGVFPAALAVVYHVKTTCPKWTVSPSSPRPQLSMIIDRALTESRIYDLPIEDAEISDYAKCAASLAIVAGRNILPVLIRIWPYLSILAAFACFIAWNGGVVLGDKSNHVATIHTPQMLYIWPYMLFFSHALTIPTAAVLLLNLSTSPPIELAKKLGLLALFTLAAVIAIHFNTIIHPFTLADNRHYVFYVFGLLRRHPAIRYLVAPVYTVSAWIIIQTLGFPRLRPKSSSTIKARRDEKKMCPNVEGCSLSFVFAWLATTALCLTSAPLVEPRYNILPWIFWRLHAPQFATRELLGQMPNNRQSEQSWRDRVLAVLRAEDLRLWLETVFFLMVNAITGYVFLKRGFEWQQEPGNIQRFMW